MSLLFVLVCASTLYASVFAFLTIFAHCAFGDHFLRCEEDINVSGTSDHIVSDNSNLADDEYESDDEEDGYMSSESHFSGEDFSALHEDDHSQSGSSATDSFWENELSETELCDTHQHTESDCDHNIPGPIDDEVLHTSPF